MIVRGAWLRRLAPLLGLAIGVALWWFATTVAVPPVSVLARFAPGPSFQALVKLLSGGDLWPHLFASLRRIVVGLAISMVVGVPVGLLVGGIRGASDLTSKEFLFVLLFFLLVWVLLVFLV